MTCPDENIREGADGPQQQPTSGPGPARGGAGDPTDGFSDRLQQEMQRSQQQDTAATETSTQATEQRQTQAGGPVGSGDHVVRQGECITSIATDQGFFWETVWNDPGNSELREVRQHPNVLLPNDRVTIPEKQRKDESIAAEMRHRFRRRGEPASLRLQFLRNGEPRAAEPYRVTIDGEEFTGQLDADGRLQVPLRANAQSGRIAIGEGDTQNEYPLHLRQLDPISEMTGVQQRLRNLGFNCRATGEHDDQTRRALRSFQAKHDCEETGNPDDATRGRIQEVHDE